VRRIEFEQTFEEAAGGGARMTVMPPSSPQDDLEALVAAIDALAARTPAELPAAFALERTRVLMEQSERLRTLALHAISDVDTRELYVLEGAPTTGAWVRQQGGSGLDRRELALARQLRSVPLVETELLSGRLCGPAAAQVSTAVAKARPFLDRPDGHIDGQPALPALYGVLVDGICQLLAEQTGGAPADDPEQQTLRAELETIVDRDASERARLEAALVLFAQRCEPGLLHAGLGLLLDALLPAEHDKRARHADENVRLDLHRNPGGSGWFVNGELDDECGEMLDTVMRAEQAVDPDNPADTDAYRAAAGEPDLDGLDPEHWPTALARPRTRGAQRHAALKSALRRLLDTGALGTRDKAFPHVAVTASLDFIQGVPGSLPGRAVSGARWSREQLRRLLCQGAFTRMVLGASRRVVQVSHTGRTLTALERQILHLEWGGVCGVAGCTRGPASGHPLVPHHVELFSHTGLTSLADTVPLCEQDHHYLHDDRRLIKLKDGRWIGPDGSVESRAA
jgi:hypothetical protein